MAETLVQSSFNGQQRSTEEIMSMSLEDLFNQEIASMVLNRYKVSEDWRREKRVIWDKCWNHFNQIYDRANKESWQSTTFMPATSKVVETIVANMYGALMGPDLPIEYQARHHKNDDLIASHNEIIKTDFERGKFKAHFMDFLRTLAICGTAVGKLDYMKREEPVMVKERRKATILDSLQGMLGREQPNLERVVEKMSVVADHASFRTADLYDIYPQPGIMDITKDTWIIEKGKVTNRELVDGLNDPDYPLINVTPSLLMSGSARIDSDPEKSARKLALMERDVPMHYLEPDREHERLEYWGPVPSWYLRPEFKDDETMKYKSLNAWIWVVDGQVVRKQLNPFWDAEPPYVKGTYIRVPNQFYGIGPAELMIGLQIEKNEIRNSRMDNVNMILNKVVTVLKDKIPKGTWDRLVSEPGKIWVAQGIDDVKKAISTIDFPDVTKDSYLASGEVDREIQETTAAVKATIGVGGADDEAGAGTFRGQLLNKQSATERFMLYARILEIMGLGDAIKKFYGRIYQYKSYEDVNIILGEERSAEFEFIGPEMIEKIARMTPIGVMSYENKGVKLAQMDAFTKLWIQEPWFKKWEMARKQIMEIGLGDPDQILFSDEEMRQFNEMKRMMIQQAGTPPQGLVGPDGQELPRSPIAGGAPQPTGGLPRPPGPAQGPGANPIDVSGRPL